MTEFKCDNCGKLKNEPQLIKVGKEYFYICNDCIKYVKKFKERYNV